MGVEDVVEIEAWLRDGGLVVTASERAARSVAADFHRARQNEGLAAWPTPKILNWRSFVRSAWDERAADDRLLLNPAQEQALWAEIAGADRFLATLLDAPRQRLAAMAMEAHELLCSHAPQLLSSSARANWMQDARAFSGWLAAFDERCRTARLLSPARLAHELIPLLKTDLSARPPLRLTGFDRILPVQRSFFDAWGDWREAGKNEPAAVVQFHAATDGQAELSACATWCNRQLDANPGARLLVVSQAANAHRGEIERAFRGHAEAKFEFSLGIPLGKVGLARAAHLLLRWLDGSLREQELDWLLSTGHAAATAQEASALEATMRTLRRFNLQRTAWTLPAFLSQRCASELLPAAWVERVLAAQRRIESLTRRVRSPLEWAELVPRLLDELQFASARPLTSAEFQALHRWQQAVESCGSLGFDGRRISWRDFLSQLGRTLDETLFAPESINAPIQIAGPAESAGLTADAIWFLGTDEDSWPATGTAHPLLPIDVQREAGMPHATAQLDWDLAAAITARLLASAPEVHFSYARQNDAVEALPSRLVVEVAGNPQPLDPAKQAATSLLTVPFEDFSRIPFPPGQIAGGAAVLTAQSQCPFKAFATARLGAQDWRPAEAGLTPAERGNLLHEVLHSVWAGPPDGIRTLAELVNLPDREAFVARHVRSVASHQLRPHLRERMPRRYLELEELRLTRLVGEWLNYEAARVDFGVAATELKQTVAIAGLTLDLRLDRVDRLSDGSQLVIDYKTGVVSATAWQTPRPDDVQLPLYAGFGIGSDEILSGLVFAKVRPGEMKFAGHVGDAAATLFPGLKGSNPLVKYPFTGEQLLAWRECIEQLARDFLAGSAEVNPRDPIKTCARCGLQSLCRILEQPARLGSEDAPEDEEAGDE